MLGRLFTFNSICSGNLYFNCKIFTCVCVHLLLITSTNKNVKFATILHNNNKRIVSIWCLAIITTTATTMQQSIFFLGLCVVLVFFSFIFIGIHFGNWHTHTRIDTDLHSITPVCAIYYIQTIFGTCSSLFFLCFAILIYKWIQFLVVTHTFRLI